MTIAMSEQVDAEPCDVLRGGDGPVYFLLGGRLYVVHEILGRWVEPDVEPRRRGQRTGSPDVGEGGQSQDGNCAGRGPRDAGSAAPGSPGRAARSEPAAESELDREEPAQVEHWLVIASVGRFGTPAVFRLQRRPAPPANGPDTWTVRAERR